MLRTLRRIVSDLINQNFTVKKLYGQAKVFLCTHSLYVWPRETLKPMWIEQGKATSPVNPSIYIPVDLSVDRLFEDILPCLDKDARILEIGCNVGRILNYLHDRGYKNLTGIEIGAGAVELMAKTFPDTYRDSTIIVGDAAAKIKELESAAYDLVYCHSVLVNIHPKHNDIFKEMARVSRKFILTLENEGSFRSYPRDFRIMFKRVGWMMIMHKVWRSGCQAWPEPFTDQDVNANNTVRLFVKDRTR